MIESGCYESIWLSPRWFWSRTGAREWRRDAKIVVNNIVNSFWLSTLSFRYFLTYIQVHWFTLFDLFLQNAQLFPCNFDQSHKDHGFWLFCSESNASFVFGSDNAKTWENWSSFIEILQQFLLWFFSEIVVEVHKNWLIHKIMAF